MGRRRAIIIAASGAAVLVVGGAVAYGYDRSRADTIAAGVRVGGVDLGGMRAQEAREALRRELVEPLRQPAVVTFEGRRFALGAREARVAVDVDRMVARALERSREGWFLARAAREVTGGGIDVDLRAGVAYSRPAVDRFARRVAQQLDRPPQDATVAFSAASLGTVDAKRGVTVRVPALRRQVTRVLTRPRSDHTVRAKVKTVAPKVTTAQLAEQYPTVITVDRANFQLRLWKHLKLVKTYSIAVGAIGLETPAGLYHIQNKAVDPVWSVPNSAWAGDLAGQSIPPGPDNPLKARWMGIYDGAGIHGTDAIYSLGTAASHGCIRMAVPDVIELYDETPVGAAVYIA